MRNYKARNKLYGLLSGVILFMSFSAMAGDVKFSEPTNATKPEKYIIVIGSETTNARNALAKQINFERINYRNDAEEIISKSEGAYIDVGELMQDQSGDLFDKIYQAYEMGAILFFDAQNQQQINFRNTFLSENFSTLKSEKQFLAVYKQSHLSSDQLIDVFFKSIQYHPLHSSNQHSDETSFDSASSSCRNLIIASAVMGVVSSVGYAAPSGRFSDATSRSASISPSSEAKSSAVPLLVILAGIDLVRSIYDLGRIIGCSGSAKNMISSEDLTAIIKNQADARELRLVQEKMDILGIHMAKEHYLLEGTGSNPSRYKQEQWVKKRLGIMDEIHPHLRQLGHKAAKVTAAIGMEEIGLLKTYYKIFEKSSDKDKQRAIAFIVGRDAEVARLKILNDTFWYIEKSQGQFLATFTTYLTPHTGRCLQWKQSICQLWTYPHSSSWGICTGSKHKQGPYCEPGTYYNDELSINAEQAARAEADKNLPWFKKRHALPAAYKAAREFTNFFSRKLKALNYKYTNLYYVNKGYTGFSLADHVVLYGDGQRKGYEIVLEANKNYSFYDLQSLGMKNNDISSLHVPPYFKAILYDHDGFSGWSLDLIESITLWGKYDNAMGAIKIIRTGHPTPPPPPTNPLKGYHHIQSLDGGNQKGLCLAVRSKGSVKTEKCKKGYAKQLWKFQNGFLKNYKGLCLAVNGRNQNKPGTKAIAWQCNQGREQRWQLLNNKQLINNSALCLKIPGRKGKVGTQVEINKCRNRNSYKWKKKWM